MSYSLSLSGGDGGGGGDVVRKMAAGQVVNVRLQPMGVNASNQVAVFANIERAMVGLGIFRAKERLGWGADANRGLIVFRAPLSTGRYTMRELANLVGPAMRRMPAVGTARAALVTVTGPRATGAVVPAAAAAATPGAAAATPGAAPDAAHPADPAAPVTPEASLPADTGGGGGGGGGGAEPEEEGFFTKKIGPVPVWAIGAGVLALGAGLVVFAIRKKPAAMQANRRRVSRNPDDAETRIAVAGLKKLRDELDRMHKSRPAEGSPEYDREVEKIELVLQKFRSEEPEYLPPPPDVIYHEGGSESLESLFPIPDAPIYEARVPRRFARRPGMEGYERDRGYVGITEGESIVLSDKAPFRRR